MPATEPDLRVAERGPFESRRYPRSEPWSLRDRSGASDSSRIRRGPTIRTASHASARVARPPRGRRPGADEAETTKLPWRERLSDLKSFLES